jgi:hypothetical protein
LTKKFKRLKVPRKRFGNSLSPVSSQQHQTPRHGHLIRLEDEDYSPHPWTQVFIRLKGFRDEDYSLEFTKEWSWNKNTEVQAERAFFNRGQMRTNASQKQMHIVKTW